MTGTQMALWLVAMALYVGQGAISLRFLWRERPERESLPYLAFGALALHACFLISRGLQAGGLPIETRLDSVMLFLWLTAVVFVAAERPYRLGGIAAIFWPLYAVCAIGMGALSGREPMARPTLEKTWLALHLIPVYAGYAGFALAAGAGLANLIEQRLLHSKRPEALWVRLPSLARLDHIGRSAISFGFPLLTVGLAVGAIWAQRQSGLLGRAWYGDTKVLAGFAGWLIYASVLHVRLSGKVSAKRAAIFTIIGFLAALATFAASHAYAARTASFPSSSLTSPKI